MEEKNYEAGKVEISSAEYRDLVKEAVEASNQASQERSLRWKAEDDLKKTTEELALTRKRVAELESILDSLKNPSPYQSAPEPGRSWRQEVTCKSNILDNRD